MTTNIPRQVNTYTIEELEEIIKVMKNFDAQETKFIKRMDLTVAPKTKGVIRIIDGKTYYESTHQSEGNYSYFER